MAQVYTRRARRSGSMIRSATSIRRTVKSAGRADTRSLRGGPPRARKPVGIRLFDPPQPAAPLTETRPGCNLRASPILPPSRPWIVRPNVPRPVRAPPIRRRAVFLTGTVAWTRAAERVRAGAAASRALGGGVGGAARRVRGHDASPAWGSRPGGADAHPDGGAAPRWRGDVSAGGVLHQPPLSALAAAGAARRLLRGGARRAARAGMAGGPAAAVRRRRVDVLRPPHLRIRRLHCVCARHAVRRAASRAGAGGAAAARGDGGKHGGPHARAGPGAADGVEPPLSHRHAGKHRRPAFARRGGGQAAAAGP